MSLYSFHGFCFAVDLLSCICSAWMVALHRADGLRDEASLGKTLVYRRTQLNCGTNETGGVLPGMLCRIWPDLHRQWQGLCCFPTGRDPYHTIKPVRCQLKAADICTIMGSILVHLSLSWQQGTFGLYAAANMWRRLLLFTDDQFPLAVLEAILQQFKRKTGLILINVHRQAVGLCGCCQFGHEMWAWEQFRG